jgi:hypothetical protein
MSFNKKQLGKDAAEAKKPISKQQQKPTFTTKSIATPNVKKMGGGIKRGC